MNALTAGEIQVLLCEIHDARSAMEIASQKAKALELRLSMALARAARVVSDGSGTYKAQD